MRKTLAKPTMRARTAGLAAALAFMAALAACSTGPRPATQADTIRATFVCNADKMLTAVFSNGAQASVALLLSDGRKLTLPQVISASGARYANADESFVFWNKGNTAFIDENGRPSYEGCIATR